MYDLCQNSEGQKRKVLHEWRSWPSPPNADRSRWARVECALGRRRNSLRYPRSLAAVPRRCGFEKLPPICLPPRKSHKVPARGHPGWGALIISPPKPERLPGVAWSTTAHDVLCATWGHRVSSRAVGMKRQGGVDETLFPAFAAASALRKCGRGRPPTLRLPLAAPTGSRSGQRVLPGPPVATRRPHRPHSQPQTNCHCARPPVGLSP